MFYRNSGRKHGILENLMLALLVAALAAKYTVPTKSNRRERSKLLPRTIWGWLAWLLVFTVGVAVYQHYHKPEAAAPAKVEQSI